MSQAPGSSYEPRPGYLVGLAVKTFLQVGVVLGMVCFFLLIALAASFRMDGAGAFDEWAGWLLERAFFDGVDSRLGAGALVGRSVWTGMRTFGLFPLTLAFMARRVSRQLWDEPRHHLIRLIGLGMFVLALLNPDDLVRSGPPYGLNIYAVTWGPALVVIGGCLDRQLFGRERPAQLREWVPGGRRAFPQVPQPGPGLPPMMMATAPPQPADRLPSPGRDPY
ncbi:hypothetical protein [uncultured Propionibacterium sp.]|uniref:hypothetical protein n=1 Tax=uncultured Propionibacterium sp. TaxID=218066 RepID=UPI0029316345|nr:hypothetical protein [uncultured Propionibacterium sp.]